MPVRLAVATEDFGTPLKDAIRQAATCPVAGLRLNVRTEVRAEEFSETGLRQLKLFVAECRMSVAGLHCSSRRSLQESEDLDRRLDRIRISMPLARKLGTRELLVRCGRIPDPDDTGAVTGDASEASGHPSNSDVDSLKNPFSYAPAVSADRICQPTGRERFDRLCEILNDLARHADRCGCVLQLVCAAFDVSRIARLLSRVQSGPVGLVFDPATAVMTGSSPVALFRAVYAHVGYVRIRDAQKDVDGAGLEVPVGEGAVNWTELVPTIAESDYHGWLCVERPGGDDRADDVRRGVAHLRSLVSPSGQNP